MPSAKLYPLLTDGEEERLRSFLVGRLASANDEAGKRNALAAHLDCATIAGMPKVPWLSGRINWFGSSSEVVARFLDALQRHLPGLLALFTGLSRPGVDEEYRPGFERVRDRLQAPVDALKQALDLLPKSDDDDVKDRLFLALKRALPEVTEQPEGYWEAIGLALPYRPRYYPQTGGKEIARYPVQYLLERLAALMTIPDASDRDRYDAAVKQAMPGLHVMAPALQHEDGSSDSAEAADFPIITVYIQEEGGKTPESEGLYTLWYTVSGGDSSAEETKGSYEELKSHSPWILSKPLFEWSAENPLVEFVLPERCLHWDVDQWQIVLDPDRLDQPDLEEYLQPLGAHAPVTLRNWRRYGKDVYARSLKKRFREAKARVQSHWCEKREEESILSIYLNDPDRRAVLYLGIGYPLDATERRGLWDAVLRLGLPVVIWRRGAISEGVLIRETLKQFLESDAGPLDFNRIPTTLREWRGRAVPGMPNYSDCAREVSLLWEDPNRLPAPPRMPIGDPLGDRGVNRSRLVD